MPIDKPKAGETQNEYLEYCVPLEIKSGKPQDQAVAICISTYKRDKMKKLSNPTSKVMAKIQYDNDFRGINLLADGLEDACWEGYVAIGTKILDGREVPNCVPKEENMEQPSVSSTYPGEVASGSISEATL